MDLIRFVDAEGSVCRKLHSCSADAEQPAPSSSPNRLLRVALQTKRGGSVARMRAPRPGDQALMPIVSVAVRPDRSPLISANCVSTPSLKTLSVAKLMSRKLAALAA